MRFAEFFAGGGMVSEALSDVGVCVFANDICPKKARSFRANHSHSDVLAVRSIETVGGRDVPTCDLIWASFPCQDLSLAGNGAGLAGARSGTFYEFVRVISEMSDMARKPRLVAIENVSGMARRRKGRDLRVVRNELTELGYTTFYIELDASAFVPQSRPRLFVVGLDSGASIPPKFLIDRNIDANGKILNSCLPLIRSSEVPDVMLAVPESVGWHSGGETKTLLGMMSEVNRCKVEEALASDEERYGFIYKRTRIENGKKVQRAEVRFDGLAGCLRTPGGGSSRQFVLHTKHGCVRTRLLCTREAARLMGLRDSYRLPTSYNEAYHLLGDGVVVPVVRHLYSEILDPLLNLDHMRQAS